MTSVNTVEFNNNFVGLSTFYLGNGTYAKDYLSVEIFNTFGFKGSDDYIDYMPDGGYLDREPFIRVVKEEPQFTTMAYADSKELPYDEHTILFTYREVTIDVHMRHISSANSTTLAFDVAKSINSTLRDMFDDGCLFLVRPEKDNVLISFAGVKLTEDDLWFCSDWKG